MYHDLSMACVAAGNVTVTRSPALILLLLSALAARASAQTIPIDDFNDGVADGWTTIDSTVGPRGPFRYGPGIFDTSSGAYHLENTGIVPVGAPNNGRLWSTWDQSSDPTFSNGFIRAKVRAETDETLVNLTLRLSGSLETGFNAYQFGAWPGRCPRSPRDGCFHVEKRQAGHGTRLEQLADPNLTFGVNEWWNIEGGAVGDEISLKVWRVGDPEPESPQLVFTDRSLNTGIFGVKANIPGVLREPGRASATFDDIMFTGAESGGPPVLPPLDENALWVSPMPIPQTSLPPTFPQTSPQRTDLRGDVPTPDGWPELRIAGQVTDLDGQPIPGLKLDFFHADVQGMFDTPETSTLRGHQFTDSDGNYELWTITPGQFETLRTRLLHFFVGGENQGYESPVYRTETFFPDPFDNDINADGAPDRAYIGGVLSDQDAIGIEDDFFVPGALSEASAEFSDLASNILTLNNDPLVDGYFDTTLNFVMPQVFQSPQSTELIALQAGDADQDLDFDQLDLVQVQVAAKYLTGQPATWGEGDWNAAPGGSPGNPPPGDGLFNQFDVVAAQQAATYLTGPYATIQPDGQSGDGQTSLVYNAISGELSVDAPAGLELTSINVDSAAGIFTGRAAENLGGSFDNDANNNIFKATFGSSFGSLSFGNVAQAGLSEDFVLGDLTVIGSLAGGRDLGNVDLVYVPEPAAVLLLSVGLASGLLHFRRINR